jgi:hypothetical protein
MLYEDFLIYGSSGVRHFAAIVADMRFTSRMAVLAAAVSLPLCAALASYALAADPGSPSVPPEVRIGESAEQHSSSATTTTTTTTVAPPPPPPPPAVPPPAPHTEVVPHAPPVSDDDDGGGDDDDDGGGDDGDD